MKIRIIATTLLLLAAFATTSHAWPKNSLPAPTVVRQATVADWQANRLIENKSESISRADALLMDDSPEVRKALKWQVVSRGLMMGYQANVFDDGFDSAMTGLRYVREARNRQRFGEFEDFPILRGKE